METERSKERRSLIVRWRIENIGLWKRGDELIALTSPVFTARVLQRNRLQLKLQPKSGAGNDDHLNLSLHLYDDSLDFPIDCEWSLIRRNGSSLVSGTMRNHVMVKNEALKMCDCPTHGEVFVTKKSVFLPNNTLTVQFRIWSSDGDFSNDEFLSLGCRLQTTDSSFPWPVRGFSVLELNQNVTAPVTFTNASMKFSLKGISLEDAEADIELTQASISTPLLVKLVVSVLDDEQKVMGGMKKKYEYLFPEKGKETSIQKFFSRNELLDVKSGNDILSLRFEVFFLRYTHFIEKYNYCSSNFEIDSMIESCTFLDASCQAEKPVEPVGISDPSTFLDASCQTSDISVGTLDISIHKEDPLAYLREDLLGLYKEKNLADFELRAGESSFSVHKNILSARSPVFRAMFSTELTDSNSLDVPDVDSLTLNLLLIYLYAGTVESLQWDNALKLYYAADKYQVHSLKQKCSTFLRSNLSVSNVSDALTLADRHQDNKMTSFVRDFVDKNFNQVMQSEEWETFQKRDSALAGMTMHKLYKQKLQRKQHWTRPILSLILMLLFLFILRIFFLFSVFRNLNNK